MKHASDCSMHNAPALEPTSCDCGVALINRLRALADEYAEKARTGFDVPAYWTFKKHRNLLREAADFIEKGRK